MLAKSIFSKLIFGAMREHEQIVECDFPAFVGQLLKTPDEVGKFGPKCFFKHSAASVSAMSGRLLFSTLLALLDLAIVWQKSLTLGCTGTNRCIDTFQRSFPWMKQKQPCGNTGIVNFCRLCKVQPAFTHAPRGERTRHETPKKSQPAAAS